MSSVPTVGLIFNPPKYLPPFTQPGGIGTATFPQQDVGSVATSQWVLPCAHGVNNFLVQSCSIAGVQTAALLCPFCSYCFRLLPWADIYSYPNEILFP
jgi:hypothetical protein